MLAALDFSDLIWIILITGGMSWYFSVETQTQRVEAKLDRILKHLGLNEDDSTPP